MSKFNTALFNLGKVIPHLWETIDKEMNLRNCAIYAYEPDNVEDPYFADGLLWRMTYFFYNKQKKRVCYLYIRALSNSSHHPYSRTMGSWKEEEDDDHWDTDNESLWEIPEYDDDEDFVDSMDL